MKQNLADVKKEIKDLYDRLHLKKHQYLLHSILMHSGSADSGHYYSFIYDQKERLWRKYSDTNVGIVSEEEVMEESMGFGSVSAYCFVYVRPEILIANVQDLGQIIPLQLKTEINADNLRLQEEVLEARSNSQLKEIQELYILRYYQASSYSSYSQELNSDIQYELINLAVYIKLDKDKENIARWYILDTCLRDVTVESTGLLELDSSDLLFKKLESTFIFQNKEAPRSLYLADSESRKLDSKTIEFFSKRYDAAIATYIIRKTNEQDYRSAFIGIGYILSQVRQDDNFYQKISIDINKVIALKLSSKINQEVYAGNLPEALNVAQDLVFIVGYFIEPQDIHVTQVKQNMTKSWQYAQEKFPTLWKQVSQGCGVAIQRLTDWQIEPTFDISDPPEDFKAVKEAIASVDPYSWIEGWKSTELATQYQNQFIRFKSNYQMWIDVHFNLYQQKTLLSSEQWAAREAKIGILPP